MDQPARSATSISLGPCVHPVRQCDVLPFRYWREEGKVEVLGVVVFVLWVVGVLRNTGQLPGMFHFDVPSATRARSGSGR